MRLTDLQISKLKPPQKGQKTYFDDALPGFGVRVSQGGSKSFVVMHSRKRKLRTLGRYPELSLKDARTAAKRIQSDMRLISEDDNSDIIPLSFEDARRRFLAETATRAKPSSVKAYRRLLERHFQFDKKLNNVSRAEIMRLLESLNETPSEKEHAYVAVRTMMNWCVKHGYLRTSPVPHLRFRSVARDRVLSDDELRSVWARAEEVGYPFGIIVQLLILTGQRRGEIVGLRRNWIKDDLITFPTGFTKNKREHRIPLGSIAKKIIDVAPSSTDLLFPSRSNADTMFSGWSKAKRNFDHDLDINPWTLHDLRRTYSSKMAELGVPIHVLEKLLNHVSGVVSGVAAIYNRHTYLPEMREAVDRYEDFFRRELD